MRGSYRVHIKEDVVMFKMPPRWLIVENYRVSSSVFNFSRIHTHCRVWLNDSLWGLLWNLKSILLHHWNWYFRADSWNDIVLDISHPADDHTSNSIDRQQLITLGNTMDKIAESLIEYYAYILGLKGEIRYYTDMTEKFNMQSFNNY